MRAGGAGTGDRGVAPPEGGGGAGPGLPVVAMGYGEVAEPGLALPRLDREVSGGAAPRFSLGRTGSCLRFAVRFPTGARGKPEAAEGEFVEGLWEYDVAELFVADASSGRYVEFNLAPSGAWWACGFGAPRTRDPGFAPPPVSAGPGGGEGTAAGGELRELWIDSRGLGFPVAGATANVAAIVGGTHFSWCELGGGRPDFHRPAGFVALV